MTYLFVALGSALGGSLRYWLSGLVANWVGQTFPWGTLAVNIIGSFAISLFGTVTGPEGRLLVPVEMRQLFMVGVCGGFTTFSSFSLQTLALLHDGEWLWAGANVVGSVILCMIGVWLGHAGGVWLNR